MLSLIMTPEFFFAIFRITAPILFATMAAVICEKAGVSNIGLEGTMMISALFGSLFAYYSGNWFVGLLVAIAVGIIVSLLMGFFAFNLKTNIILTGTAVNMIGSGGTIFLVKVITGITQGTQLTSTTSLITQKLQIPSITIPLIDKIPVIGQVLSGHSLLTYFAFICVFLTWVLLYHTPLGLNIRSVGENSHAASSVGVSVIKVKYITMGAGEPLGCMLAALIFGFAQAFGIKLSATGVDSNLVSPIPYLVTIIGLVVFAIIAASRAKRARRESAEKVSA